MQILELTWTTLKNNLGESSASTSCSFFKSSLFQRRQADTHTREHTATYCHDGPHWPTKVDVPCCPAAKPDRQVYRATPPNTNAKFFLQHLRAIFASWIIA